MLLAREWQGRLPGSRGGKGETVKKNLTKRTVDAIPAGSPNGTWYPDTELPGFFLVSYATGKKTFFVRYRTPSGGRRVVKVGPYGSLTVDKAREKAKEYLSTANLGGDPGAEKQRRRDLPTWGEWVKTYLTRVRLTKRRPREDERFLGETWDGRDTSDVYSALRRRWQGRPLDELAVEDVEDFRAELGKEHRPAANRWLASVRACLAAAKRSGHIRFNVAAGLKAFREAPPRARVLTSDEMEALLRAIKAEEDAHARAALSILVETGCRLSEVLRAQWGDFDLEADLPTWRIPSPKSGTPQTLPLAKSTSALLKKVPHFGCYVIAGRFKDRARFDLSGAWERAKEAAGLKDAGIRIHDVRRTFGLSLAQTAGLHVASKLLRHADIRVTERVYAPLGLEDLRAALEKRAPVLVFDGKRKKRKAG
jgi:integrase